MENTLSQTAPSRALVIAAFAALYIIWGSTYLAILIAIRDIPPFMMSGLRFSIAGVLLYAWCRRQGEANPSLDSAARISMAGVLMLFFGTGAVVWVEQYLPSGIVAIIVASVPLWFVLLDKRQWHFNFSNKWIITGLAVGFAGVILLFSGKAGSVVAGDTMKLVSVFVMIAGCISWAIGSLYSKYKKLDGSSGMKAALQMIAAGVVSIIVSVMTGETRGFQISNVSAEAAAALAYLITFGSLIGYMSYVWLLSIKPASLVGTYAYVNPVVAVLLGWLFASEQISINQVLALVVIIGGVVMVNFAKESKI